MTKLKKTGRPQIIDDTKLQLLRAAFNMDATDEESCAYAGISPASLYNYQQKHPDFLEEKKALKKKPIMTARKTIIESLIDPDIAKWYLERKAKDEFSIKALLSTQISSKFSLSEILDEVDKEEKAKPC